MSHQPEDSAEAKGERAGEQGQIHPTWNILRSNFFPTLAHPNCSCWWLSAVPHSDCSFSVLVGEQRKGKSFSHTSPLSLASQFGLRFLDFIFIYSIYLFIGS